MAYIDGELLPSINVPENVCVLDVRPVSGDLFSPYVVFVFCDGSIDFGVEIF